jgi:PAS domain S-box-containing protein
MPLIPGYEIQTHLCDRGNINIYTAIRLCDRQAVVLKIVRDHAESIEDVVKLKHEYEIIKDLAANITCKCYGLEQLGNLYVLILQHSGEESLHTYIANQKFNIKNFLKLSINIVAALGYLHQNHIIHNDIKPENIIIHRATKKIKIIDFGIASRCNQKTKNIHHSNLILGTLAYISPEQTGRMNRAIDYRTDFYSLGVTFYQMLTGKLPFETQEPMELLHSHIAKQPIPPHQIIPKITPVISDIVLKLMSKNPEDRYKSTFGLIHDLNQCLVQLNKYRRIDNFILGQQDKSSSFEIPQNLYGRELEIQQLLSAFKKVDQGGKELLLVAGYAGVGKTELINTFKKNIIKDTGYFLSGKFSKIHQDIPYSAFNQAFKELIKQLLTEDDSQIKKWQNIILEHLGSNAQIIVDFIPDLELIIGKQPTVPPLEITESQNRFNLVFQKFIRIFIHPEYPLVIFLDDLQWADSASLTLIQLLMMSTDIQHLLLIGTYRHHEVNHQHLLMKILTEIQNNKAQVNTINLKPLHVNYINQLLIDVCNCQPEVSSLLAEILYNKTNGNPFFLIQLLKTIYQDKLVNFDYQYGVWQWNIEQIKVMAISDNVIELMISKIKRLNPHTQNILKLASCIGNQFDLNTLSIINKTNIYQTEDAIIEAVNTGLILLINDDTDQIQSTYQFLHDRVQQAAYSLIPEPHKQAIHWQIGKLLLNQTPLEKIENNIFNVVNQLNLGYASNNIESEKNELAKLNMVAGKKAKAKNAYLSSLKYFQTGLELLNPDSWLSDYELTLTLYLENIKLEFINTHTQSAFSLSKIALKQTKHILDQVKLYELQIKFYISQNQMQQALDMGLQVLKILQINLNQEISQQLIIEDLLNLPEMILPNKIAAVNILETMTAPAFISNPELILPIITTMINICSQYGNTASAAYAYGLYGLLLCGSIQEIDLGYKVGKLALQLVEKLDAQPKMSRVYHLVSSCIFHWKEHGRQTLELSQKAIEIGLRNGDLEYTSYAAMFYSQNILLLGLPLADVANEQSKYINLIEQLNYEFSFYFTKIWKQFTLKLLDNRDYPCCLMGEELNELEVLPYLLGVNNIHSLFSIYSAKAILCYLFGEYKKSVKNAKMAEKYIDPIRTTMGYVNYIFYYSLAILAEYSQSDSQKNMLDLVIDNQKIMKIWADNSPENYQHKYDLIEAEKARIFGQELLAMEYYDRAISGARKNEYIHEEALANERAADFYLSLGRIKIAELYIKEAYYCYSNWGAKAKVKQLQLQYAKLLNPISAANIININQANHRNLNATPTNNTKISAIDLETVIRASQAIASEIIIDNLLEKLMKIVIENAGAQSGYLLLEIDEKLLIKAQGKVELHTENLQILIHPHQPLDLPVSIINYVHRSLDDVVLDDASCESIFSTDTYLIAQKPKSILCTAIISQAKCIGILYLENNLTTGAFSLERLEILKILSSQAAISLENASLYQTMASLNNSLFQEIQERKQAEQALSHSEKRLSQFLEAVPVGIFVTDSCGKPYYANQTAKKILGKGIISNTSVDKLPEIYQAYVADTQDIYPVQKQPILKALKGEIAYVNDMEIHQGNRIIPLAVSATPIYDQSGEIIYAIAVFRDITERKQAEAEIINFTKELSQKNIALQRATEELANSNANLEKKVQERTKKLLHTLEILKATQSELLIENALLKREENISQYEYQVGGSLPMDAPSYVVRSADRYLYKSLKLGEFCYVLNARQMGKSSLRVQIMKKLQAEGFVCAAVDISEIGNHCITMEQWYAGFIYILANNLNLLAKVDVRKWWREYEMLSPVQRLSEFLHYILLPNISEEVIIFIDEIDSVINLGFEIDDFFILIRNCYNQRAHVPEYKRLTFVLFGVATSSQFIKDKNRTPFNIGNAIPLRGFQLHEAQPLLQGLQEKVSDPQAVLKEVLRWTNGQPFLTQKICKLIRSSLSQIAAGDEAEWIENLIQTQIIDNWESSDEPEHLRTIRDRLCHHTGKNHAPNQELAATNIWKIYQQILLQGEITAVDSPEVRELLLSGLIIQEQEMLKVHNRIYELVFNPDWVVRMSLANS